MNTFYPTTGIESEWIEAHFRVEAYLKALQLDNQEQRGRIIQTVLQKAALRHAQNPSENPTVLAMNEIRNLSEQWFGKVLLSQERAPAVGFVSLFAIDAMKKWPQAFLSEPVPVDFQRKLQECEISAAPNLNVSSMVPQPFDNPLRDMNLPSALGELTKGLTPSFVAKAVIFVLSGISVLLGNRLR